MLLWISDIALKLLKSYLENRIQKVDVNGTRSAGSVVKMGVPQGSILGPFLFLVYINDLPFSVQGRADIVLFADDTSLIFKVDRRNSNLDEVNNALRQVSIWFAANNLVLNPKKTKCIKFSPPNVKHADQVLMLDNNKLDFVDSTTFLGIKIDSKLQWGPHIGTLSSRLSSAVFAIRKIRHLTDIPTARLVYFSYFHSIMSYGILLWGRAADIETIFILQKRAIRAIYNLRSRESLRERFKDIEILTVPCQYIFDNILYVRKNISMFLKNSDRHNLNTRHKSRLAVPYFRLTKSKTSFMGHCIRFYNKIPSSIQNLTDINFKAHVKQVLCKKAYYKVEDFINDKITWC